MNLFFKDLLGIFNIFEGIYERARKILIPPKAYSWQTFIYLSIFSWIMSYCATGYIRDIIALFGWLFLIAGTAWYTTDDPLRVPGTFMPIGAVITGFLVSVFAFGNQQDVITPRTIVLWPTISALITAIPEFIEGNDIDSKTRIPKPDDRPKIIVLVASCMIISCWLQFYFVMDNWLKQYPTLLSEDFARSSFVFTRIEPQKIPTNGVIILDRLQPLVEEQIADKPWSEVERWLIEANVNVGRLGMQVLDNNLSQYEEKELWRVEPRVFNIKSGYRLDLLSIWTGPTANPRGFFLRKSCLIDPIAAAPRTTTTNRRIPEDKNIVAEIQCDRSSKLFSGSVPPQQ